MGHKRFGIKLKDQPVQDHPFGKIVIYRAGEFLTVHAHWMHSAKRCGYCESFIRRGEPYVRFHTLRHEVTGLPDHEPRCMTCIGRGILPEGIEYITVFEKQSKES